MIFLQSIINLKVKICIDFVKIKFFQNALIVSNFLSKVFRCNLFHNVKR